MIEIEDSRDRKSPLYINLFHLLAFNPLSAEPLSENVLMILPV